MNEVVVARTPFTTIPSECPYADEDGTDCDECGMCDELNAEFDIDLDDSGD